MGLIEGMRNRARSTSSGNDLVAAPSAAVPPLPLSATSQRAQPPAAGGSSQEGEPDSPRDEPETPTSPDSSGRPRVDSSRGGIILRAQKKVAGKMASSETAKKLIRKFCPPEMFGAAASLMPNPLPPVVPAEPSDERSPQACSTRWGASRGVTRVHRPTLRSSRRRRCSSSASRWR